MGELASEDRNERRSEHNTTLVDHSVDELAKGLATGTLSRRKALRMLGGALVGATLASIPGAAWAACRPLLHKCTGNFECCSRNCIKNPQGNGKICGCPTGKTLCGGNQCVTCPAPRVLDTTTCACECPAPTPTYCAATNTCVNTQTDNFNCGGCGKGCTVRQTCISGNCENICLRSSCCCSCLYRDNVTGELQFGTCTNVTSTATFPSTPGQCNAFCESATPPGTTFVSGSFLCPEREELNDGFQRTCTADNRCGLTRCVPPPT